MLSIPFPVTLYLVTDKNAKKRFKAKQIMSANQTKWYVGSIYRCPTNYTTPQRIAIEANDLRHAEERLYKLYDDNYDRGRVYFDVATDTDYLNGARKYPLPSPL